MRAILMVILVTAGGVLEFFTAHPVDNPAVKALLERLAALIAEFRTLGQKQGDARKSKRRANVRRSAVAREIRYYLLRPISAFAAAAFKDDPARIALFRIPATGSRGKEAFLIQARAIHANVTANLDLLLAQGMNPALPGELAEALAEYERLPVEATNGKRTAAGARDGIESATDEIMDILQQLDGVNRHRFRTEPELLAEWEVVRNIPWPKYPRKGKQDPAPTPAPQPEGTGG